MAIPSATFTQTQATDPINITLRILKPLERIKAAIRVGVAEMLSSGLFNAQYAAVISEWEAQFYKEFESLNTDQEKRSASISLCTLICEIIRPVLRTSREVRLLDFEDAFTVILNLALPATENAESFLKKFEEASFEEPIFEKKKAVIEEESNKLLELISDLGNAAMSKIQKAHSGIIEKVAKLKVVNEESIKSSDAKMDALASKTKSVYDKQVALTAKAKAVGDQAMKQIATDKQIIINGIET